MPELALVDLDPVIGRAEPDREIQDLLLASGDSTSAAPSSTIIQPSEVHTGVCGEPARELDKLFASLVLA